MVMIPFSCGHLQPTCLHTLTHIDCSQHQVNTFFRLSLPVHIKFSSDGTITCSFKIADFFLLRMYKHFCGRNLASFTKRPPKQVASWPFWEVWNVYHSLLLALSGALNVIICYHRSAATFQFSLSPRYSVTTITQDCYYIINATESSSHN